MNIPIRITYSDSFDPSISGNTKRQITQFSEDAWDLWQSALNLRNVDNSAVFDITYTNRGQVAGSFFSKVKAGETQSGSEVYIPSFLVETWGGTINSDRIHEPFPSFPDDQNGLYAIGSDFGDVAFGGPVQTLAHEFGHILGIAGSDVSEGFLNKFETFLSPSSDGTVFDGPTARAVADDPIPLRDPGQGHFDEVESVMAGSTRSPTLLDAAVLADIGYMTGLEDDRKNVFTNTPEDDLFVGDPNQYDIAIFFEEKGHFEIANTDGMVVVVGDNRDRLQNIEELQFTDQTVEVSALKPVRSDVSPDDVTDVFRFYNTKAGGAFLHG